MLTAVLFGALLSLQLGLLRKFFTQQAKDARIINKEVMNEYDTKFVHPTLNRPARNVGTQTKESASKAHARTREVDVYTPTTIINRGFRVNPNPSYSSHLDEEGENSIDSPTTNRLPRSGTAPLLRTPLNGGKRTYSSFGTQPERSNEFASPVRQPQARMQSPMKGDGGSLGVYSHAASPLKKAASSGHLRPDSRGDGSYSSARTGSPLKRMSTPGDAGLGSRTGIGGDRLAHRFSNLRESRRETGQY